MAFEVRKPYAFLMVSFALVFRPSGVIGDRVIGDSHLFESNRVIGVIGDSHLFRDH